MALGGAGNAQVMAVANRIQGLERKLACLSQMVQTGIKLETIGKEEGEKAKAALGGLIEGPVFNEAVAQENRHSSRSEELWAVSQRMTGSAFTTVEVSTSASGIHNFSPEIKV